MIINVTDYVLSWKSKGLSDETIKPPSTSDNSLTPALSYYRASKIRVKFTESCLKQDKVTFNHGKVVNTYIVYELGASSSSNSNPTKNICLSGAVTLTKNVDIDKYRYSGYGIGFDRRLSFSFGAVDLLKIQYFWGRHEFIYSYWWLGKRYFNSWKRTNARIRWELINCRKNVFN